MINIEQLYFKKLASYLKSITPFGTIFLILLVATILRFYDLGGESLWYDETYTWHLTQKSWSGMFTGLRNPGGELPLFYIGVKFMTSILGSSNEWSLRLLSALT